MRPPDTTGSDTPITALLNAASSSVVVPSILAASIFSANFGWDFLYFVRVVFPMRAFFLAYTSLHPSERHRRMVARSLAPTFLLGAIFLLPSFSGTPFAISHLSSSVAHIMAKLPVVVNPRE